VKINITYNQLLKIHCQRARKFYSSYCTDTWFWVQDKWYFWNL